MWRSAPALAVVAQAIVIAALLLNTRPLDVNGGLGYDGRQYAAIVAALRGAATAPQSPFAYRIFPAALVAASDFDVRTGFFALNAAALIASILLLLRMLRAAGAQPGSALLLVTWCGLLPNAFRFVIAYPVLVDGIGFLFFVALLVAVLERRMVSFAAILTLGCLTREHLILFAPLALTLAGGHRVRGFVAATLPALAAMVLVRVVPPYQVTGESSVAFLLVNGYELLTNSNGALIRLAVAPFLGLGVFVSLAFAFPTAFRRVLQQPAWRYTAAVIVLSAAVGGSEHERYLIWLVPVAMIAVARVTFGGVEALLLTGLQLVAARTFVPLDGTARAYLAFAPATMPLDALVMAMSVAFASVLLGAIVLRAARRTTRMTA